MNPLVVCLLVSGPPKVFRVLATAEFANEAFGFWEALAKVAPGRFESVLSSNAFFLFWMFVGAGIAKGEVARLVCDVGWPKAGADALFGLFERDANGLEEAAAPKGFIAVVEVEFKLPNGLLAAVFCEGVLKGFKAVPVGAAIAAANGLLMVVSLFVVLNPPRAPPLFDDVELGASVAFREPKVVKLGFEEL